MYTIPGLYKSNVTLCDLERSLRGRAYWNGLYLGNSASQNKNKLNLGRLRIKSICKPYLGYLGHVTLQ